jgi:membrane protein
VGKSFFYIFGNNFSNSRVENLAMKETPTKYHQINSLAELQNYRNQLKQNYTCIGNEIKQHSVKTLFSFFTWRSSKRLSSSSNSKYKKVTPAKLTNKLTQELVRIIVPRRWGWTEKWFLSLFLKDALKKFINRGINSLQPQPIVSSSLSVNSSMLEQSNTKSENMQEKNTTILPKEKLSFKGIWEVIKNAFNGFGEHKVTKISGSLAYYTVFSMAPLLVVVIALCGLFLEREAAQGEIFRQLKGFLGSETAAQLQELIKNASIGDKGIMASVIGGVTLLVGATTIFADIQDSINTIWGIKPKPKRGWLKLLMNRFLSFSVIVSLGFLLLVSLLISTLLDGFSAQLEARFADVSVVVFTVLNTIVTLLVVSSIFGVIFKVLPDAKIRWKDIISGAIVTAVLFMLGKLAISFYIGTSDVASTYGAAGSLVILLLWAYYSSIILYFGAEFTKAYAIKYGEEIHPAAYAVTLREVEVEEGKDSIQEVEKKKED